MPDTFKLAVETLGELLSEISESSMASTDVVQPRSEDEFPLEKAIRGLYFSLEKRGILTHVIHHPAFTSRKPLTKPPEWLKDNWGRVPSG